LTGGGKLNRGGPATGCVQQITRRGEKALQKPKLNIGKGQGENGGGDDRPEIWYDILTRRKWNEEKRTKRENKETKQPKPYKDS